ncbi:MAG: ABC transporter permease [Anaerolineales bacterium]|nr:ABC transporter permease [Anaerolineales bacterium]
MSHYIIRRLFQAIPTLLGITIISFALIHLAPGDPLARFEDPNVSKVTIEQLRANLGLDQPLPVQYAIWLGRLFQLDLGRSFVTKDRVLNMILERVPATLELSLAALSLGLLIGVPAGVFAAVKRGSLPDNLIRVLAVVGNAVPHFWLGLVCIIIFSVNLHWLPSGGIRSVRAEEAGLFDHLRHLLLPALITSTGWIAVFSRYMRTEMLEVIRQDYIRTAYAKGLKPRVVFFVHALRNALIPLITVLGGSLPALLSGAAISEYVFSWPGMGRMAVDAVFARDYPVTMGLLLVSSVLIVAGNLLSDIAYGWVDPRIRLQ